DIFVARNVASTLKLGQARGAIIVAAKAASLPVFEYSANQVKKAVTGYGHATKEQIQKMTQNLLKMPEVSYRKEEDALAVAICHHNSRGLLEKIKKTEQRTKNN
ncbi:MAG: crossover junction endodeoxyribonuclease RuvC, partial [Deltaproteobacteria bacterium]|nr:crossover junction endodeoxyribonuclease RuvC [Deltaproteobacteria bacterium]